MKKNLFYFLFLLTIQLWAQVPDKPNPARLVNNFSKEFPNFISSQQQQVLEDELEKFSQETSNQICIVIVDDLNGYDAASYATEIGNKWGVGKSDFKNGVVILVKPTGGQGHRDLFIAVGYGLEGAIPDLTTKRIRENDIEPFFAVGEYYDGLQAGVNSLMQAAKGEYNYKQDKSNSTVGIEGWVRHHPILFIIIVILIVLLLIGNGKGGRGGTYYGGGFIGGFGGGSGGGGGSSFGGFGGGSFGGGGSGGSW